jgi:citrate synthase
VTGQADQRRVERRADRFAERAATRIWHEEPAADNPYVAAAARCHGYELSQLMQRCSYPQVLFLLMRGELPDARQAQLLERLMIGLINPGPRHPATRAAMNAAIGKTDASHVLPIALTVLGGEHLGAAEVEPSMRFLRKAADRPPQQVAAELMAQYGDQHGDPDCHLVPGFGRRFGSVDVLAAKIADELVATAGEGSMLAWGRDFSSQLHEQHMGWLATGVAAAAFCDLGIMPRAAAGLFQLICAPGLLAHGVELANKPVTALPWITDENYIVEDGQHGSVG